MARTIAKLSPLALIGAKTRGYYGDGGGLYLRVGPTGAKSWVYRFKEAGRVREMGRRGPPEGAGVTQDAD